MTKTKKNQVLDPIREAKRELTLYLMMLRQKYDLHTNDIPDLLDAASVSWFIENCRAHYMFKDHGIPGYEHAIPVLHAGVVKIEKKEEPLPILNSGLFRSVR
jgi:hypothetical protein